MAKYNHSRRILNTQPTTIKSLLPGMIIRFNYSGANIFDSTPLVLLFYNEYRHISKSYNIHGLNINYITEYRLTKLFTLLSKTTSIRQVDKDEDNTNLLSEDYTRIYLPPLSKMETKSRSEALVEMKRMYKNKVKPLLRNISCYRTYDIRNISSLKAIKYKIG